MMKMMHSGDIFRAFHCVFSREITDMQHYFYQENRVDKYWTLRLHGRRIDVILFA